MRHRYHPISNLWIWIPCSVRNAYTLSKSRANISVYGTFTTIFLKSWPVRIHAPVVLAARRSPLLSASLSRGWSSKFCLPPLMVMRSLGSWSRHSCESRLSTESGRVSYASRRYCALFGCGSPAPQGEHLNNVKKQSDTGGSAPVGTQAFFNGLRGVLNKSWLSTKNFSHCEFERIPVRI